MRVHSVSLLSVVCLLAGASPDTVGRASSSVTGLVAQGIGVRPVHEVILDNGFRMLIVEERSVPRVAASLWFRVGSILEHYGEHGSVHFLEHMLFQGTTTVGTVDFASERRILQDLHDTEQQLIAEWNRIRNDMRQREVFVDELLWPTSDEAERLRRRLYDLEDEQAAFREYWAEYGWYRRHGGIMRHTDPVPATTGNEHMVIEVDLPRERLEMFFRLEAERLVNAVPRGFEAQRFTVLEQILNRHNRPETGRFFERLNGATSIVHPSFLSAGGELRDFAFYSRAGILRIYDDYFVPNNATLALVGDVDINEAKQLAERYFGRIPRGPEPPARMDVVAEPPPGGSIRLDWLEPLDPRVVVRYRIPGLGHEDRPVFDAVVSLLGGRQGLLASSPRLAGASGGVDFRVTAGRSGSISALDVMATVSREADLAVVEQAIIEVIENLKLGGTRESDLRRARRSLQLSWAQAQAERGNLAAELGRFQVADHWRTMQSFMADREAATALDIARVARRYLVPANRVVATAGRGLPGVTPAIHAPVTPAPFGGRP